MSKLLCLLVLATGCQLAQVDVEVKSLRLTYHDVAMQDAHGAAAAQKSFAFDDLAAAQELVAHGGTVTFAGAELRATSGVDALTFVEGMDISLASGDPMAQLPALLVSECNGTCATHERSLELPALGDADATPYVSTGSLLLDVGMRGRLPGKDWTVDFDLVLQGSLDYSVDP